MQQDLLIREQGLQAVAPIVTIVAFRTLAAVHIPVAAVLPVIVRLTLTVVVELLLPVVVFLVAVGLPVVPEAVFPAHGFPYHDQMLNDLTCWLNRLPSK